MQERDVTRAVEGLRQAAPRSLVGAVLERTGLDLERATWSSPLGPAVVVWGKQGVVGIDPAAEPVGRAIPQRLRESLDRLMAGKRARVALDLRDVSPFERAVLGKTAEIPFGQVRSYAWVAKEIGHPAAVRAVGTALGRNPVPLVVPCHRVVRTDGSVGNYGFGSPAKRALLTAEGADPDGLERLASGGTRFVGSATTRVYCHPTCVHARRIADRNRVPLRSAADAATRGFRACLTCRP